MCRQQQGGGADNHSATRISVGGGHTPGEVNTLKGHACSLGSQDAEAGNLRCLQGEQRVATGEAHVVPASS